MKNITLKQLRAFVEIANEKNFSRAAHRLFVSPSALTVTIRDLEREVDTPLFDRSTRFVELTDGGLRFLPVATALLEDLCRGVENLQAHTRHEKGSVVLTATSSFIHVVVAPAIANLSQAYPGIHVRILEELANTQIERVIRGEADFGITTSWQLPHDVESKKLLTDQLGVLCPKNHPLVSRKKPLRWSDLTAYPLAALNPGAGYRDMIDHHQALAPILPKPMYEVSTVSSLLTLIEQGVGIAIFPAIAALPGQDRNLAFLPVSQPTLTRDLMLIKRQGHSLRPAAQLMLTFIRDQIEHLSTMNAVGVVAAKKD